MVPRELRICFGYLDIYYNSSSFLESYEKMADVDIDRFGEHDKTDLHPDENILPPPVNRVYLGIRT